MNLEQKIEQWLKQSISAKALTDRPFISLCYAQSIDGSITIKSGSSLALSGPESTRLTHQLRATHDGIMVGVETVLADNPRLSVRECKGENPQPIVVDSHLRIPATAKLCQLEQGKCWVLTTVAEDTLSDKALEIMQIETNEQGRVCLHSAMRVLSAKGIKSVMVEGGAKLITAFIKAGLADAVVITMAPTFVGGYKAVGQLDYSNKGQLPRISPMHTGVLGDDLIMWGNMEFGNN